MTTNKFWLLDFKTYVKRQVTEYVRNKSYKSDGSPTIRGWHVYHKITNEESNLLINLEGVVIDENKTFSENYKINKKIFFKWVKENINFE